MSAVEISLGAVEPPLKEQLRGVLPVKLLRIFERHNQAINRLHVFCLLSPREAESARRRLVRKIQQKVTELRRDAR